MFDLESTKSLIGCEGVRWPPLFCQLCYHPSLTKYDHSLCLMVRTLCHLTPSLPTQIKLHLTGKARLIYNFNSCTNLSNYIKYMSCTNANNWKILLLIYKAKHQTALLKSRKRWTDNELVGPQILQPFLSLADGVLYDSRWPIKRLHYWTWSMKPLSCKFKPVAELFLIFSYTKYGQRCRKWQRSSWRDRAECKTRQYKDSNSVVDDKAREIGIENKLKLQTRVCAWWDLMVSFIIICPCILAIMIIARLSPGHIVYIWPL